MSDLHTFDANSPNEIAKRQSELRHRCDIELAQVFHKSYDIRQAFGAWLSTVMADSENPIWILHDEPLLIVAEYLGMDATTIITDDPLATQYGQLSRKYNW